MTVDYFSLISCDPEHPYRFNDKILIYPPTLETIRCMDGKYKTYQSYTNILSMTKDDIADSLEIPIEAIKGDALLFITKIPIFRDAYVAALSFFIHQPLRYDDDVGYLLEDGTSVSMDELREIRKIILQFSYIEDTEESVPKKFRNAKAKKIYERIQGLKSEQKKKNKGKPANPDMELSNLIGAISAFSPSYNFSNIWCLTVYQFYDQFIRLNTKIQIDISGVRWAAWGQDDFDWALWHKSIKNNSNKE